jgi:hypothetical protein
MPVIARNKMNPWISKKYSFILIFTILIAQVLFACSSEQFQEPTITPTLKLTETSTNTITPSLTPTITMTSTPIPIIIDGAPDDWANAKFIKITDQINDLVELPGVKDPQSAKWLDITNELVLIQEENLYLLIEVAEDIRPNDPNTGIIGFLIEMIDDPNQKTHKSFSIWYYIGKGIDYLYGEGKKPEILDSSIIKAAYKNRYVEISVPYKVIRNKLTDRFYIKIGSARNVELGPSSATYPKLRILRQADVNNEYTLILSQ